MPEPKGVTFTGKPFQAYTVPNNKRLRERGKVSLSDERTPVLLMVSGGSDSIAMLELCCKYSRPCETTSFRLNPAASEKTPLLAQLASCLPPADVCRFHVLHVNHLLRGEDSDGDEEFVVARCNQLGIPCSVRRFDAAAAAENSRGGVEAVARSVRYRLAAEELDSLCEKAGVPADKGIVCTAHTLDDRIETFYMRSLVGTGPGGFGSIPKKRGRIRRPLLNATREELRQWLRARNPGASDFELWREDASNEDGSNFRSQVRTRLMPVLRDLRPGFEASIARSMDLIADEEEGLAQIAEGYVYRNASWDKGCVHIPVEGILKQPRFLARRILKALLLMVSPASRLESEQIQRLLDGLGAKGFSTDVSGGIRIRSDGTILTAMLVEGSSGGGRAGADEDAHASNKEAGRS